MILSSQNWGFGRKLEAPLPRPQSWIAPAPVCEDWS